MGLYYTLFFYFFIIGFFDLFGDEKTKNIFFNFSFLFLVLFGGLRFDTGWDYATYRYYFDLLPNFHDLFSNSGVLEFNSVYFEFGFKILIVFLKSIGIGFQGFIFLCNLITLWLVFNSFNYFNKFFPYKNIMVLIFYSTLYLMLNFSVLRQGISIGIILYSVRFIIESKYIKYYILVFISYLFHTSSLIFVIIPIFFMLNFNIKYMLLLFIVSILVYIFKINWVSFFVDNIFPFLSDKYYAYVNNNIFGGSRILGIGFIEKVSFLLFFIFFYLKYKDSPYYIYKLRAIKLLLYIYFLYVIIYLLFFEVEVIYSRLRLSFMLFFIISFVMVLNYFKNNSKVIVYFIVSIYSLFMFYNQNSYIPNQIVFAPYHHIFEEGSIPSDEKGYNRMHRAENIDHKNRSN